MSDRGTQCSPRNHRRPEDHLKQSDFKKMPGTIVYKAPRQAKVKKEPSTNEPVHEDTSAYSMVRIKTEPPDVHEDINIADTKIDIDFKTNNVNEPSPQGNKLCEVMYHKQIKQEIVDTDDDSSALQEIMVVEIPAFIIKSEDTKVKEEKFEDEIDEPAICMDDMKPQLSNVGLIMNPGHSGSGKFQGDGDVSEEIVERKKGKGRLKRSRSPVVEDPSCQIDWNEQFNCRYENEPGSAQHPYHCNTCALSFPSRIRLKHHLRTHRPRIVFKCPMCEKLFLSNTALSKHMKLTYCKRKTKIDEYPCGYCNAIFSSSFWLNNHVKRKCENRHLHEQVNTPLGETASKFRLPQSRFDKLCPKRVYSGPASRKTD